MIALGAGAELRIQAAKFLVHIISHICEPQSIRSASACVRTGTAELGRRKWEDAHKAGLDEYQKKESLKSAILVLKREFAAILEKDGMSAGDQMDIIVGDLIGLTHTHTTLSYFVIFCQGLIISSIFGLSAQNFRLWKGLMLNRVLPRLGLSRFIERQESSHGNNNNSSRPSHLTRQKSSQNSLRDSSHTEHSATEVFSSLLFHTNTMCF